MPVAAVARLIRHAGVLVLPLFLGACASQPEPVHAPVAVPEQFSASGETPLPDRWWTEFNDAALDELVGRALAANLSLKATYQSLVQARAVADRQGAALFPTLDATAGAERRETETTEVDRFSVGLAAGYELDLWGRLQSRSEAEALRARASLADYQAAAVSLAGEVSNTWFRLVEQRAQRQLAREQLKTNQDVLSLIETRFGSGLSTSADVLRQRQLVEASRERLLGLVSEIRVLEHQLSVLTGETPTESQLPPGHTLPELPALPETGLPAALVERRPDLQRAHRLLQAADADLAAAVSNRFPRLTLSASLTSEAESTDELFENWLTSLAGNLVVPLIDGGQRRAEVRRSESLREQRLYEYGQAALTAFREVEDALVRERQQYQRIDSLQQQVELADATYRQLQTQYFNGTTDYINVLNALRERQDLRRSLVSARRQLLGFRVALYRSLAGRFETDGGNHEPSS